MPSDAALPASGLSAVPSTLRIPLAARAFGDAMFPRLAIGDASAARLLATLEDQAPPLPRDRATVYGVLARTRCFRALARDFLQAHAGGHVVNLGCGLSHYFQWLDDGRSRMTDADLPEVLAVRRALMADDASAQGLDVQPLGEAAQATLREWVPFAAPRNPVDITGQVTNDMSLLERSARLMLDDRGFASWMGFLAAAGA
ncbi:class I SAM-dependent methyltransferase, partial [Variovorax sp. CT11-76]